VPVCLLFFSRSLFDRCYFVPCMGYIRCLCTVCFSVLGLCCSRGFFSALFFYMFCAVWNLEIYDFKV